MSVVLSHKSLFCLGEHGRLTGRLQSRAKKRGFSTWVMVFAIPIGFEGLSECFGEVLWREKSQI